LRLGKTVSPKKQDPKTVWANEFWITKLGLKE